MFMTSGRADPAPTGQEEDTIDLPCEAATPNPTRLRLCALSLSLLSLCLRGISVVVTHSVPLLLARFEHKASEKRSINSKDEKKSIIQSISSIPRVHSFPILRPSDTVIPD